MIGTIAAAPATSAAAVNRQNLIVASVSGWLTLTEAIRQIWIPTGADGAGHRRGGVGLDITVDEQAVRSADRPVTRGG
ncbi:hypothetical protein [Dactylosporangium sp. NPDC005555]|uniref:hypothetical protein n=1 Tax=Dactylosporangium sp. NPDC005555 TaxID=3154889 RepID=UPI0033A045DE